MFDHSRIRKELGQLDAILRQIASRPVDINDPNWQIKLKSLRPLDEAGVRTEVESLLLEILVQYAAGSSVERDELRKLIAEFPSFAWAAIPPSAETVRETVRLRFIHFSLLDQGRDPRDAVLRFADLCQAEDIAIGDLKSIRSEVAQMSSNDNRSGFGSTRAMLLRGYGQFGAESAPERE